MKKTIAPKYKKVRSAENESAEKAIVPKRT